MQLPSSSVIGRRISRVVLSLGLLAVLVALLYAALPWLAARWLPWLAAGYGVEIYELALSRPGASGLLVHRLAFSSGRLHVSASEGSVRYDLGALLEGRATSVTFRQLTIEVADPPDADAAPARSADAATPLHPAALFEFVPAARMAVRTLVVAVPALDFRAVGDLHMEAQTLTVSLDAQAPPRAERFALRTTADRDGGVAATLTDTRAGTRVLALTSRLAGERLDVAGDLALTGFPLELAAVLAGVPLEDGSISATVEGSLPWPPADASAWRAASATGTFEAGWQMPGQPWRLRQAGGRWNLADSVLSADADAALTYAGERFHLAVSGARLDLDSGNAAGALVLADRAGAEPYLSLAGSLAPPTLALDGRAALRDRLLALVKAQAALPAGTGALRSTFAVTLPWPPQSLSLSPRALAVSGEGTLDGRWSNAESDVALRELTGTWRLRGGELSGQARGRLDHGGLSADVGATLDAWQPAPMRAQGELRLGKLAPLRVTYQAQSDQPPSVAVQGRIQVRDSLANDALDGWSQPYDLADGAINVDAHLRLPPTGAPQGRVRFDLEQVSGHYGEYLVEGLNAALELDAAASGWSLAPTPVRASRLATGVDLENVQSGVAWSGAAVDVQATTAELLGGELRVAPFSYHLENGTGETLVQLEDLDLARILALEGEQIAGTGMVDGSLPVQFQGGAPSVAGGTVHADEAGGVIRVSPALAGATGQPGLDFALRALQDFRYQVLRAEVDYSVAGDLDLAVHLEGSNPDIESGRPIHYNVNVSENVPTLLRALRLQDDVTRGIERRMNN